MLFSRFICNALKADMVITGEYLAIYHISMSMSYSLKTLWIQLFWELAEHQKTLYYLLTESLSALNEFGE